MRSIAQLLEQHGNIWFWISDEYRERFGEELAELGAHFPKGQVPDPEDVSHCMALHGGGTVAYVSNLVWYNTFYASGAPIKVDYEKYAEGMDDFIIRQPNIKPLFCA